MKIPFSTPISSAARFEHARAAETDCSCKEQSPDSGCSCTGECPDSCKPTK